MNLSRPLLLLTALVCAPMAWAADWSAITTDEAGQALRDCLGQGARVAIARLGRENGYFGDPKVKIGLPKNFARAEGILRALGMGKEVDDLVLSMNRAAEAALPEARGIVLEALLKLSVADAKVILSGGDGAATAWFRKNTETQLDEKLAPLVHAAAEHSDLVRAYNTMAAKLAQFGHIKSDRSTVEDYVDRKAMDGFYALVAEEEHAIRAHPLNEAGGAIGKVFGLLN